MTFDIVVAPGFRLQFIRSAFRYFRFYSTLRAPVHRHLGVALRDETVANVSGDRNIPHFPNDNRIAAALPTLIFSCHKQFDNVL